MNLKIKFGSTALVAPSDNVALLIKAFEEGKLYSCNWDGTLSQEADLKLEFSFIKPEDLVPPTDVVVTLQKEKADSDKRWIDYYNKHTEAQKKIKELEDKIARMTKAVVEDPVVSTDTPF